MEGRWAASLTKRPTVGTEFYPMSKNNEQRGNARGSAGVASGTSAAPLHRFQPLENQVFFQQPFEQGGARTQNVIE